MGGFCRPVGAATEAEEFVRANWGRMLARGAWTCWEYLVDTASRCHAWSGSPTYYLSSKVLGVSFPRPGNVNVVRVDPQPGSLQWARGVFPHPAGPIHVAWKRKDGRLLLDVQLPEGVELAPTDPA